MNGRQEGVGVKHYADGRRYQGAFQQGAYSGQGFLQHLTVGVIPGNG